MKGYEPRSYGDKIADIYDAYVAEVPLHVEATVSTLAELAGEGPVLELGIGTGRVALPLAERGVAVHGIDVSEAMVSQLRAKPGGERIPVTIGDFADVKVDETFSLVFVVFNTFFGLTSQEEQVRCFANVAARLTDHGRFVIEAFVPDLARFDRGQSIRTHRVEANGVQIEASIHDPQNQRVATQHIFISEDRIRLVPISIRYAWPSELDLMAQTAGLRLRDRWGGWRREPFTAASKQHVSVYERA